MNENRIGKDFKIVGKEKTYLALNMIYWCDNNKEVLNRHFKTCEETKNFEDSNITELSYVFEGGVIAVFATEFFTNTIPEIIYFKADFYDRFTPYNFLEVDSSNHKVYLIKSTKDNSTQIIEDIQKSENFKPHLV